MEFLKGVQYNLRGLGMGLRNGKLLFWGMIRFLTVVVITIASIGVIFAYHESILNLIWARPESAWLVWIWVLLSWLLALILIAASVLLSYLLSQILFSVFIMDLMSRRTEQLLTGGVEEPQGASAFSVLLYIIRQEIPRTILPVVLSLVLFLVGWLTPLGPVIAVLSSATAAVFLAWDNTDLVPARRLEPFRNRLRFLRQSISFHLGFGILFLIPIANILLLAFAPVGATMYHIDRGQNTTTRSAATPMEDSPA